MNRHVNAIAGRLSLRPPQRRSLEILDRITEIAPPKKGADVQAALEAIRREFPSVTDFEREFPSLCFAAREGFTRADDRLPIRFMTEPVPDGPMKGAMIPKETLERLKDDYYTYRGWDKSTGNPSKAMLTELGLEFAIKDIC